MRRSGFRLLVITAGYGMLGTVLAACSTGMASLSPITGRGEAVANLFRFS